MSKLVQAGGTLNITSGGSVSNTYGYIGYSSGVTVDGTGSTWTNSGEFYVGYNGSGTLSITNGGTVISGDPNYIGYNSGSTGVVTVSDSGSTWTSKTDLYIGYSGSGTLNITSGGSVTVAGTTYVGYNDGSTATINGTLTIASLAASFSQLTGTCTINTRGLITDENLVFDSSASLKKTSTYNSGSGQNITVNLDMATTPSSNGALGVGWKGNGSLSITNGVAVTSACGYIGFNSGSTGIATVSGSGSKWTNTFLYVGLSGSGARKYHEWRFRRQYWHCRL